MTELTLQITGVSIEGDRRVLHARERTGLAGNRCAFFIRGPLATQFELGDEVTITVERPM